MGQGPWAQVLWAPRLPSKGSGPMGPRAHGARARGQGRARAGPQKKIFLDFSWGPGRAIFGISSKFAAQGASRYSIWSRERPNHEVPLPCAQMVPGPKWAQGPNGPLAQIGPGPKRALGPNEPWAQMGPGPKWAPGPNALGPNGPQAHMGPGPKWAQGRGPV